MELLRVPDTEKALIRNLNLARLPVPPASLINHFKYLDTQSFGPGSLESVRKWLKNPDEFFETWRVSRLSRLPLRVFSGEYWGTVKEVIEGRPLKHPSSRRSSPQVIHPDYRPPY